MQWNIIQPSKEGNPDTCYTTWMNFEDIMLNVRSRLQKNDYCMYPFIYST